MAEGEALTLMDRDGPCQTNRELAIDTDLLFLYLLFFLVKGITDIAPLCRFYLIFLPIFSDYIEELFLFIDGFYHAQGSVHPAFVHVVLDEDDLSTRLQIQFNGCGQVTLRKFTCDGALEEGGVSG